MVVPSVSDMTVLANDQLLTEFLSWAERTGRPVEPAVLAAVLRARVLRGHDPRTWRRGEVRPCVLDALLLDVVVLTAGSALLAATLDAFFRFLRNTGRLRSGSEDVATLRRESARAVRDLEEMLRAALPPPFEPGGPGAERRALLCDLGVTCGVGVPLPPIERSVEIGASGSLVRRPCAVPQVADDPLPARRLSRLVMQGRELIDELLDEVAPSGLVALLVWSLLDDGGWVDLDECVDLSAHRDVAFLDEEADGLARDDLELALDTLVDARVVDRQRDEARLTDLGMWVVDSWVEEQWE